MPMNNAITEEYNAPEGFKIPDYHDGDFKFPQPSSHPCAVTRKEIQRKIFDILEPMACDDFDKAIAYDALNMIMLSVIPMNQRKPYNTDRDATYSLRGLFHSFPMKRADLSDSMIGNWEQRRKEYKDA